MRAEDEGSLVLDGRQSREAIPDPGRRVDLVYGEAEDEQVMLRQGVRRLEAHHGDRETRGFDLPSKEPADVMAPAGAPEVEDQDLRHAVLPPRRCARNGIVRRVRTTRPDGNTRSALRDCTAETVASGPGRGNVATAANAG
jgi:hypothetical protein